VKAEPVQLVCRPIEFIGAVSVKSTALLLTATTPSEIAVRVFRQDVSFIDICEFMLNLSFLFFFLICSKPHKREVKPFRNLRHNL
jgi:hypothetical protein